jgi:hypothetical protein
MAGGGAPLRFEKADRPMKSHCAPSQLKINLMKMNTRVIRKEKKMK